MSERKQLPRVHPWAVLATALVTVIIVLVNYISSRRYERFDWTQERLFTLSERTTSMLHALDKPVELYVFMSSGEPSYQDLRELIERYRAASTQVAVQYVDPDREPARFKLLSEKYGVRAGQQENGQTEADLAAIVVSGDKRWSITRDDLVDVDFDSLEGGRGGGGAKVNVKTEQALSGAIVQVTSGRATKVCISDGHGEWSLTDSAERPLAAVKEALKRENVEVETIGTRGKAELPRACDALFVLGPQKAFSEEEAALLDKYLAAGGNVLLALDPVIENNAVAPTGLEAFASKHGLRIDADVLVELDRERLLTPSPVEATLITEFGPSPVMRPLAALRAPVVLQLARTISIAKDGQTLLIASDKAYGETKLEQLTAGDDLKASDGDVQGPVNVAVLVDTIAKKDGAPKQLGGRLLVIGDSDWLQPQLLQQPQLANIDLLSSVTGYLTEREALISIAARKIDAQAMTITEDDLFGVFVRVVLLMPLGLLILGVAVWWQRRA